MVRVYLNDEFVIRKIIRDDFVIFWKRWEDDIFRLLFLKVEFLRYIFERLKFLLRRISICEDKYILEENKICFCEEIDVLLLEYKEIKILFVISEFWKKIE